MVTDRPGREVPKDYRPVIEDLIDNQGWRYSTGGKGHPRLYPADKTQPRIVISGTPGNERRGRKNLIRAVERAGGIVR